MFLFIRAAVIVFVAFLIANKWGDLPHPDTGTLQGAWQIVSVERSGVPDPSVTGFTLTFADNQVHFQVPLDMPVPTLTFPSVPISEAKMQEMALR
jgi:hypothetical protein